MPSARQEVRPMIKLTDKGMPSVALETRVLTYYLKVKIYPVEIEN